MAPSCLVIHLKEDVILTVRLFDCSVHLRQVIKFKSRFPFGSYLIDPSISACLS